MSEHNENVERENVVGPEMRKPFDPNNIKVRLEPIPIYSMCERIRHKEVKLDTAFQRKEGLWKDVQQSRLIESILIRFPLPVFYFEGSNANEWLVIDGLQRLTSLKRFILTKELKLTDLEFLKRLENKGWDDLDRPQQRQINETSLQCHIIEHDDKEAVFHIFKRINTGGLNLSSQEIRHAMHQDVADFLKTLAESEEFKEATKNRINPERMLDREFVNRFLAFYIFSYEKDYSKEDDLETFMNRALNKVSSLPSSETEDIETRFKKAMVLAEKIFEEYAFCKSPGRKQINRALFEVISVSFAKLSNRQRELILDRKELFKNNFYEAIENKFKHDLTSGGKSSIASRHTVFESIVDNILNN